MKKLIYIILLSLLNSALAADRIVPEVKQQIAYSFAPLAEKVAPSVVNIYTKKRVIVDNIHTPFADDPLFQLFNDHPFARKSERVENSLGSGVVIDHKGIIITNHHVVKDAEHIIVAFHDKREYEAKTILIDRKTDLALLKLMDAPKNLPAIEICDSDEVKVGDLVLAIGNPFNLGQTVTSGIVSALARATGLGEDLQFFIQTDAAINPGNSGGPLIDMRGKLIGINTVIYSNSGGYQGVGFAVPSNVVKTVYSSYKSNPNSDNIRVTRPWLGVEIQEIDKVMADSLGVTFPSGLIVRQVYKNSAAEKAGIKVGDIITSFNNIKLHDDHNLRYYIAISQLGSDIDIEVIRGGKSIKVRAKMSSAPDLPKPDTRLITGNNPLDGATIENLSPALAADRGLPASSSGVVISKTSSPSISVRLGFHENDIIKRVNGTDVKDTKQLENLLNKGAREWYVSFVRGSEIYNLKVN